MAAGGTPLTGDALQRGRLRGRARRRRSSSPPSARPRWKAPHFVWPVRARARRHGCAARTPRPARSSSAAASTVITTIDLRAPGDRREVGQGGGHRPPREEPEGGRQGARARRTSRGWRTCATRSCATAPWSRMDYQTGELVAYVGSADSDRDQGDQAVPAPVRRPRRRLAPARLGVQAVRLRDRHRRRDDHRGHDVHGRRHRLRRRLHADRRRQPRARARSASATPCSSRSTSRRSRRSRSSATTPSRPRPRRWASSFRDGETDAGLVARAGRRGGPAGGPGPRLRHAREQRQARAPHDDPHGRGQRRHRADRREPRPAGARAGRWTRDGRRSSPTSWPATPTPTSTRSGASSRSPRATAPPGDAQDRHQQRRQGPQRLRLHRRARAPRSGRTASTPWPSAPGTATPTTRW